MSRWTRAADIRSRLQREWERGRLPTALLGGEPLLPLRIPLRGPGGRELGEQFAEARAWVAEHEAAARRGAYPLEWKEIHHRQLGRNRLPVAARIETEQVALGLIGKAREAARLRALAATVRGAFPALEPWLLRHPLQLLEREREWPRLLGVLQWVSEHPRPGIYLRQMDVPGVDTKFIERRRRLLGELLDLVLPPEAIDHDATGAARFEQRYGFLGKPPRIRFRLLDRSLAIQGLTDLTVPATGFARLALPVDRVFITENEINGLAFPALPRALVIFGLGYGLDLLTGARWLQDTEIHYWGDIDTHGFAMLDQLRSAFPAARSLLMDRATLLAHRALWGSEAKPVDHDLSRLTPEESALYDDLRRDRLAPALRLEQERIGYRWLEAALAAYRAA